MLRTVDIEAVWPRVEESARATLIDPEELSADDMREACAAGEWICAECDEGILTYRVWVNPKTSFRELIIWFGVSETDSGAFARALPDLHRVRADLGCVNIVYYTNKPGMMRLGRSLGARVRNIEMVIPGEGMH